MDPEQTRDLIEQCQQRSARDYGRLPVWLGLAMIVTGTLHIVLTREFSFSLTVMVWGAIIVSLGLWLRHRSAAQQLELAGRILEWDQNMRRAAQRGSILQKIVEDGIPDGMTAEQLDKLLGNEDLDAENLT